MIRHGGRFEHLARAGSRLFSPEALDRSALRRSFIERLLECVLTAVAPSSLVSGPDSVQLYQGIPC
jgi:hypothetical protein